MTLNFECRYRDWWEDNPKLDWPRFDPSTTRELLRGTKYTIDQFQTDLLAKIQQTGKER